LALAKWGAPRQEPYAYLKNIHQPTLIVNGSNDVIIYTVNSYILQQGLPNARLILYPDSNHGSQYQYPELFVEHVTQLKRPYRQLYEARLPEILRTPRILSFYEPIRSMPYGGWASTRRSAHGLFCGVSESRGKLENEISSARFQI
jgi:hypothetical protein